MLRIVGCITQQHDIRLVVLAALLCLFACFTAFGLIGRAQLSAGRRIRDLWIFGAAIVAGCGVWATHFIAMLAFEPGLPLGYDLELTAASIVVAVTMIWLALRIALSAPSRLALGGAALGLGVASMHFVGMAAVRVPAVVGHDLSYVVAAILFGVACAAAAMRVAERLEPRRRAAAALILSIGICGLHFTGMSAVTLTPDPFSVLFDDPVTQPQWMATAIAATAALIIALGLVGSAVDGHLAQRAAAEADRLRRHVAVLEATQRELKETTGHLQQALRLADAANEAKTRFIAAMSHEFRTPLHSVLGFAELIVADGHRESAACRDYAAEILRSGQRLAGLVDDILDFSKLQSGRLELCDEEVDLRELAAGAAAASRGEVEQAGLTLRCALPEGLPAVRGDARRLRQALGKLLSNAIKFTPKGGEVRLAAARLGDEVLLSVSDTGVGLAPGSIAAALEPFGQADAALSRRFEGGGLGLPISKALLELHGGALRLASPGPGRGVTATMVLRNLAPGGRRQAA